jgi:hypothetical protein
MERLRDGARQTAEDVEAGRVGDVVDLRASVPPAPPARARRRLLALARRPRTRVGRRDRAEQEARRPASMSIHDLAQYWSGRRDAVESAWRRTFKGIHVMGRPGSRGGLQAFALGQRELPGPRPGRRAERNRVRARSGPHVYPRCGSRLRSRRGELRCGFHGGAWWR